MNTQTITAQSCSLFEIDAELEEAFDQLQEERDMTGMISDESRERCTQLFAELGKKIDRIKTAAERVLQLAHENRLYAGLTSMR
jgi:vacuolar-type H+-ATPase subunit I/STV1